MADDMKKVGVDELEEVAGGKKKHHNYEEKADIASCPPGTIEVKNESLTNYHETKKKCPNCKSEKIETKSFFINETGRLVDGQECNECHTRWITA